MGYLFRVRLSNHSGCEVRVLFSQSQIPFNKFVIPPLIKSFYRISQMILHAV